MRKRDDRTESKNHTNTSKTDPLNSKTGPNSPNDLSTTQLLKQIEIPPELRSNPAEAQKYRMEQLKKKTEELTGIKIPTFYNIGSVNPLVYAEQQRKRKLLWSKSKDNENVTFF